MARVDLHGLDKSFGAAAALSGLDLGIADGEFTVVVGPSGCGKSTLLRIIAGLEQPSAGDVLIDGVSVLDDTPAERGVAMVFQSYALYPHLNVFDNMAFGLRMAKTPEAEVRAAIERAAGMLGIEGLLDRRPRALSGGQRQRVAIGRAIVRQPRLFLLDEPLSNLDAGLRVHMRHEFARLHRELKTTMIYVTHDQVEAMTLADRIVVLNGGRIEQTGTPAEIYHSPKNLFVASFLGSPRMNLMAGEVTGAGADGVRVRLASGAEVTAAAEPVPVGAPVTLGVRPDALRRGEGGNALLAVVDVVENLGAVQTVYTVAEAGQGALCAVLPGEELLRHDDLIGLTFAPEDAYLFDAEGVAVRRATERPDRR